MITYQQEHWNAYWKDSKELNMQDYIEVWKHKDKMPYKPNVEMYKKMENEGQLLIFTARDDNKLIGFQIYFIASNSHSVDTLCAYQDALYVDKNYRGFVSVMLLSFAEKIIKQLGITMLICSVPNEKSVKLFNKLGFELTDYVMSKWIGE